MAVPRREGTTNVNVSRPAPPAPETAPPASNPAAAAVAKINQVLWFLAIVLELLLALRVGLLLIGANPGTPFVRLIYALSQPFAAPFLGLLPNPPGATGRPVSVFEVSTLIAMVAYLLFFLLLTQLLRVLVSRPRAEA
jgi:uncharacterized protein YggT (Ycf19 family)